MFKITLNGVTIAKDFRNKKDAIQYAQLKGWHKAIISKQ